MEERTVDGEEFDFEHSNLVPPPPKSLPTLLRHGWWLPETRCVSIWRCTALARRGAAAEGLEEPLQLPFVLLQAGF